MSRAMNARIDEAISKGWRFVYATDDRAVLSYPATASLDTGGHLFNLALTFLTCGLWLIPWLIIIAIDASTAQPAQTLVITEVDGIITDRISRS